MRFGIQKIHERVFHVAHSSLLWMRWHPKCHFTFPESFYPLVLHSHLSVMYMADRHDHRHLCQFGTSENSVHFLSCYTSLTPSNVHLYPTGVNFDAGKSFAHTAQIILRTSSWNHVLLSRCHCTSNYTLRSVWRTDSWAVGSILPLLHEIPAI